MKATIYFQGDPSIGIFSEQFTIECPLNKGDDKEDLEFFRNCLSKGYAELLQGPCVVLYDFEEPHLPTTPPDYPTETRSIVFRVEGVLTERKMYLSLAQYPVSDDDQKVIGYISLIPDGVVVYHNDTGMQALLPLKEIWNSYCNFFGVTEHKFKP